MSSAYRWILELPAFLLMSLMKVANSVGPRIEPCGTPLEMVRGAVMKFSDLTCWTRWFK